MELEYSPRHTGTSFHLLSPSHAHGAAVDGFASIRQIRRSLSRSPSKPSRYSIVATKSNSASAIAASSPRPHPPSALSRAASTERSQFDIKLSSSVSRSAPVRTRSLRRTSPSSPLRRALSDNTNQANSVPHPSIRRTSFEYDQENMDCAEDMGKAAPERVRFDGPIKLDFARPGSERLLEPVMREHASPMKSSPLKRSDGVMNLEAARFESPRNSKRRSLHGASLGADFNIFDHGLDGALSEATESSEEKDRHNAPTMSWGASSTNSPQRRPSNLRKSTLQQRMGSGRRSIFMESAREPTLSPALTRARSRISLDGALPLRSPDMDSPFRRGSANEAPVFFPPPAQRLHQSAPKPHPLSHALTPSSSSTSITEYQSSRAPPFAQATANVADSSKMFPGFSQSLPIGALRPTQDRDSTQSSEGSFATPVGYKMAKPLPQAFMSTGLISKRNRHVDIAPTALFSSTHMPDTPSKKARHVHIAPTPARSGLGKVSEPKHEFGSPSTPFNGRISRFSPEYFGENVNIFGSRVNVPQLTRRGSFLSIDGDEGNGSPTHKLESQSSNDDLPPTPTKSTSTATRPQSKGKSSSLRSSLFGRRTSLGPDTFASPAERERERELSPTAFDDNSLSPKASHEVMEKRSPHTPHESYTPPDPSTLSISAGNRSSFLLHGNSFPPATPTGPRVDSFGISLGQSHNASSGYFANDVDTTLTSRFGHVASLGVGEFSQVYKVQKMLPHNSPCSRQKQRAGINIWAVKKSRKPYTGIKDRQRKLHEVQILNALRGREHVIEFVDHWEAKNHLYIQTEYCENGNLKDFLTQTGFKGRLDDFRIWKILLELCQGVKTIHDAGFIHLDLKPANVFIDWEGLLKIGDFGMASAWPAPPGLDGEGDREYIGPEVLSGRFDKPADIFSLGMIMLEIAGNIVLPDNGTSWQRLRSGDMSDLPSLTSSSDGSLARDDSGDPIDLLSGQSNESLCTSDQGVDAADDDLSFLRQSAPKAERSRDLVEPPNFMIDSSDPEALDKVVQWMINPDPDQRPCIDELLAAGGVQWIEQRRRAGATVFEGNWGPADDVLNHGQDVEMMDVDRF